MSHENFMGELYGYRKKEIFAYFGAPRIRRGSLNVFDCPGGIVAATFQMEKLTSYALYAADGTLLRADALKPLTLTGEEIKNAENLDMSSFVRAYGIPHADLGDGMPVPAYLSAHASAYRLSIVNGLIRRIVELPLLPSAESVGTDEKTAKGAKQGCIN